MRIGNVVEHDLHDEMRDSYINYAMSVIIGRALPDVRDGLKPVHRRILYGMHEGGHTHEKPFTKSARSVGEVMGKYHPHGDGSIYDTMVRMAQDFSLRYPLVDGQGNFGSIDGDPPAAMRYTESRLDRITTGLLADIDKETVDFQPNFDDSESEPTVLPAGMPNLLLNGSDGIAVGMATKIPPHNLEELTDVVRLHINTIKEAGVDAADADTAPTISVAQYMQHIQGPDFPTGATIHGIDGIRDMYETGKGKFHIRSDCDVIDEKGEKAIIVNAIPFQVKKDEMLEKIAGLVSNDTVKGIRDIRDESSKEGIRVVIEVKQNADPHAVLNQLYKSSRLQESYSANMMGIINGRPVQLNLSTIIHTWLRHREDVVRRRTQYELAKAEARIHLIEGLLIVAEHGREITEIIRQCEDYQEVHDRLSETYSMSAIQTKAVYDMPLGRLTRQSVGKLQNEAEDLGKNILRYNEILASRTEILDIVMDELQTLSNRHSDERRTDVNPIPLSMDNENLIEELPIVLTLSKANYIKHTPTEDFRVQRRAGKGLKGVITKAEDMPQSVHACFSKDRLLILTNLGRVYGLKAWETPMTSRSAKGTHIKNLIERFRDDETVVTILPIDKEVLENPDGYFLVFATRNGKVKRTALTHYVSINRNGKKAIKLIEGDSLISVRLFSHGDEVVLITANGRACRFNGSEARAQGRVSQGVSGIKFKHEGDHVVGMIVSNNSDTQILTISQQGMGKRTRLGTSELLPDFDADGVQRYDKEGQPATKRDGYRKTHRGAIGVTTMKMNESDEIVAVRQIPDLDDQLFILAENGMMIRIRASQTKETTGRFTRGTRLMELREQDEDGRKLGSFKSRIIAVARLPAGLIDDDGDEIDSTADAGEEE